MLRDNKTVLVTVKNQRNELKGKVDRLHRFVMKSEDFKQLSPSHQLLLKKQLYYMIKTLEILEERVKDLSKQVEREESEEVGR